MTSHIWPERVHVESTYPTSVGANSMHDVGSRGTLCPEITAAAVEAVYLENADADNTC